MSDLTRAPNRPGLQAVAYRVGTHASFLASMLRRQLEAFEYRATVHTGSLEALEDFRARPHEFDLLMTDNSMPRMSGIQLAREIRRIRPDLPVLLVSGTAALADPAEIEAIGAVHLLGKPHTGRQMHEALLRALGRPEES